jgi:hypothetical protein
MARRALNKVLFSHSFCLYVSNFRHSDWSRTQNVNKRADWLTLFALVYALQFTKNQDILGMKLSCITAR